MFHKIRALVLSAVLLFTCSTVLSAAENRTPTPEEFKEMVRKFNESGKPPALQRQLQQPPKGAVEFNRAVTLHTGKSPSTKDFKEAATLYQIALDAGIPQAGTNLALLYLEGKGVKKDVKKGLVLLNAASAKNETQADVTLARLYLIGKDVPKDEKKAEGILNRAAKTGNQNAVKMLAEYKEWKKKNDLAMKEYQEMMKKVQLTQIKPGGAIPPLQFNTQPGGAAPAAIPFPVIPGYAYVSDRKPAMPNFLTVAAPPPSQPPQPLNILPQGTPVPPGLTINTNGKPAPLPAPKAPATDKQ